MVDHFVANDALAGLRPVLVDVVFEVSQTGVAADDQHFGNAVECVADLAKELVLAAHITVVLTGEFSMFVDFLFHYMIRVELQHLGRVMIDERDGVK